MKNNEGLGKGEKLKQGSKNRDFYEEILYNQRTVVMVDLSLFCLMKWDVILYQTDITVVLGLMEALMSSLNTSKYFKKKKMF